MIRENQVIKDRKEILEIKGRREKVIKDRKVNLKREKREMIILLKVRRVKLVIKDKRVM